MNPVPARSPLLTSPASDLPRWRFCTSARARVCVRAWGERRFGPTASCSHANRPKRFPSPRSTSSSKQSVSKKKTIRGGWRKKTNMNGNNGGGYASFRPLSTNGGGMRVSASVFSFLFVYFCRPTQKHVWVSSAFRESRGGLFFLVGGLRGAGSSTFFSPPLVCLLSQPLSLLLFLLSEKLKPRRSSFSLLRVVFVGDITRKLCAWLLLGVFFWDASVFPLGVFFFFLTFFTRSILEFNI